MGWVERGEHRRTFAKRDIYFSGSGDMEGSATILPTNCNYSTFTRPRHAFGQGARSHACVSKKGIRGRSNEQVSQRNVSTRYIMRGYECQPKHQRRTAIPRRRFSAFRGIPSAEGPTHAAGWNPSGGVAGHGTLPAKTRVAAVGTARRRGGEGHVLTTSTSLVRRRPSLYRPKEAPAGGGR